VNDYSIPDSVDEVAYYSAYGHGRAPRIVKVVRRTATTLQVEGLTNTVFRKQDGVEKSAAGGSRSHVRIVTPEIRDHIAAEELHRELSRLHKLLEAKVNELGQSRHWGRKVAEVKVHMSRLQEACMALGLDPEQVFPVPFAGEAEPAHG
jgi:hypothetical protein